MASKSKHSAGILVYRGSAATLELLLVHPGGPFWAKKDLGAWFIPKGEIEAEEDPLHAALREFQEELGMPPPPGAPLALGSLKNKGGKLIDAWALAGDLTLSGFRSNTFALEWPPRSGKMCDFPEVDRAEYFDVVTATSKMHEAERPFIERLLRALTPD